jgi:hypothetical protein
MPTSVGAGKGDPREKQIGTPSAFVTRDIAFTKEYFDQLDHVLAAIHLRTLRRLGE